MRLVALLAAAVLLAASPVMAYGSRYRSSDGSMVHVPYKGRHRGEQDRGGDGSHSMSHHHRGTCSHHGGVARFER